VKSNNKPIEIESMYDYHFDVFGIRVKDDYKYKESLELEEGIILDFDEDNFPVALEILDASKILKIPDKQYLNNRKSVKMNICITDEIISLEVEVGVIIHHKNDIKILDSSAINDIKAPAMKTELASV
jgi:uncharacterized protein YuzE